jgi:2-isopropylmalate synthase
VHCHNELGLAVANSLAAIENGIRQVECTIDGIGEGAGNTALQPVVNALRSREDAFPSVTTTVAVEHFPTASQLVREVRKSA